MWKCPTCGALALQRSRTRRRERPRRWLFGGSFYRCGACQWRGWQADPAAPASPTEERRPPRDRREWAVALALVLFIIVALAAFEGMRRMMLSDADFGNASPPASGTMP